MAGYDVPLVTHDMILRFMGVNFTALTDGSVRIPSTDGSESKPIPAVLDEQPTPTPARFVDQGQRGQGCRRRGQIANACPQPLRFRCG